MRVSSYRTEKEIEKAAQDFGFSSKEEFISHAVEEKIFELRKMQFFAVSERIRKGLAEKGLKPEKLLKEFKS